jgi:iron(III) transport system substrate-binding protein
MAGVAAPLAAACGSARGPSGAPAAPSPTGTAPETELTLYSARKEELMQPVVDAFVKKSGIKVTVKSGAPGELVLLIEQERTSPRGDVFFTTDAAGAEQLRQKGILEPYRSPNAERIPAEFKAADGGWTGVIGRSRNIMINTNLVKAAEAPMSVFDLTAARWKDKVAVASIREGGVRLWLASLLLLKGEEFTTRYLNELKANGMKVLTNHTEVANAVARGEFPLGLLNHYYYVPKKREGAPVDLIYPDQGPNDIGTLVMPLAVAILKGAPHSRAARAFVDFVLSPEGQLPMTTQEQEFPLTPGAPLGDAAVPGVRPIDQIKRPSLDFVQLASAEKRAVELYTPLMSA